MKSLHHMLMPLGLLGSFGTLALALEGPEDKSPPPAQPAGQAQELAPPPVDPEVAEVAEVAPAAAYLGLGVCELPDMLAAHLGLPPDTGVVVRTIDPNGPAARAGIAQHDVITRIGGQALASHFDLTRVVQKHQPGAELAVDFIHQGKPVTKTATLVPRPDGAGAAAPEMLDKLRLGGMPEEQAARIKELIERQLKAFEGLPAQGVDGGIKVQGGATFRMLNADGSSVELNAKDGGKEATIRDKDGKATWSGPWDTEQDKAAAPADVRASLERLNIDSSGIGLRLNFGGGNLAAPDQDQPGADAKPKLDRAAPPPPAPKGGAIR